MREFHETVLRMVMEDVFKSEMEQFQKRVDDVVSRNHLLSGKSDYSAWGFQYLGRWYGHSAFSRAQGASGSQACLHQSLHAEMAELRHYQERVEGDRQSIRQLLSRMICACSSNQEVRDELPETVCSLNDYWSGWQRTPGKSPGARVRLDARGARQYEKVSLKIDAYCAMRFLV